MQSPDNNATNVPRHLASGIVAGLIGMALFWFFLGDSPPFSRDTDFWTDVENLWRALHIPAWIVAFAIDRNPHGGAAGPVLLGVFLQWFIAGWIASWLWIRTREDKERPA